MPKKRTFQLSEAHCQLVAMALRIHASTKANPMGKVKATLESWERWGLHISDEVKQKIKVDAERQLSTTLITAELADMFWAMPKLRLVELEEDEEEEVA